MQQADFSSRNVCLQGPLTSSEKDKIKNRRKKGGEGGMAGKQETGDREISLSLSPVTII